MDNGAQIQALKHALNEIPYLRSRNHRDNEFNLWQGRVLGLLESIYGKDAAESRRFANATGTVFAAHNETGLQQDYEWRLDTYESVLKAMIK